VVALDWPRPDFRFASLEFLVGLLSTAFPPEGSMVWRDLWEEPPPPEVLDKAFAPIAHAFALDGDGPRFLQDLENLASEPEPIERLLIESPGASTLRNNTDLLVRRNRLASLGRPAAAMALYAFQSWAPAGGAGNRTGLRGGGPLCTLVAPPEGGTLWSLLWANVLPGEPPDLDDLPRILPWLAPTVTSEGARVVTPGNSHPLQCWWGMPRRIRLDFAPADPAAPCGLTGMPDSVRVTGWRQRPRGANYAAWGLAHPLTPHYRLKPTDQEWLPIHPQPGGVGYRHWVGLVIAAPEGTRLPAKAVAEWRREGQRARDLGGVRLLAAGFDMDNMKARGFVESEMPLPGAVDEKAREAQDAFATALIRAADGVAMLLRGAVRAALFSPGATVKLDAELLSAQRERVWERTEGPFFEALNGTRDDSAKTAHENWLALLRRTALALFDEAAPLSPDTTDRSAAPRIAAARRRLVFALTGYGKDGAALFLTLGLASPEPKPLRKGKAT
jgi:CRISPR system Cascade subunit CasA